MFPILRSNLARGSARSVLRIVADAVAFGVFAVSGAAARACAAQDDPLNKVHVPPPTAATPAAGRARRRRSARR